jgi:hypothetical protein
MLAREKHFSAWGRSDIAAYLVRWEMLDLEEAARGTNGTFCAGERKRRHGLRWTLSSPCHHQASSPFSSSRIRSCRWRVQDEHRARGGRAANGAACPVSPRNVHHRALRWVQKLCSPIAQEGLHQQRGRGRYPRCYVAPLG